MCHGTLQICGVRGRNLLSSLGLPFARELGIISCAVVFRDGVERHSIQFVDRQCLYNKRKANKSVFNFLRQLTSGVASMEQMEQLLPPDCRGPLLQIVHIRLDFWGVKGSCLTAYWALTPVFHCYSLRALVSLISGLQPVEQWNSLNVASDCADTDL